MKKCSKCKKLKLLSDFDRKGISKKGEQIFSSHCKECRRLYIKDHYKRHIDIYVAKAKRNRAIACKSYDDYKQGLFCFDCGISFKKHPYLCDFHHIEKNKKYNIGSVKGSTIKFKKEIKKCIPLCANCHRIRHHSKTTISSEEEH